METKKVTVSKRADISLLRIAATLAVILCHVGATMDTNPVWVDLECTPRAFFCTLRYGAFWHVPMFFMITGALLLTRDRKLTPVDCVRKYALRVFLALVIFGIPFSIIELFFNTKTISVAMFWRAVCNVVNGESWNHLWYLYTILGMYLLLPVFKRFTDNASHRELGYVLAVLFVCDFCFPLFDALAGTDIAFGVPVLYPVFYLLLGHYLAEDMPRLLRSRAVCACGGGVVHCVNSGKLQCIPGGGCMDHL